MKHICPPDPAQAREGEIEHVPVCSLPQSEKGRGVARLTFRLERALLRPLNFRISHVLKKAGVVPVLKKASGSYLTSKQHESTLLAKRNVDLGQSCIVANAHVHSMPV
eukprot:2457840-Pleurochrysis_carterae.AAC.6